MPEQAKPPSSIIQEAHLLSRLGDVGGAVRGARESRKPSAEVDVDNLEAVLNLAYDGLRARLKDQSSGTQGAQTTPKTT